MSSQADRMIQLRKHSRLSQTDFAKSIGLSRTAITNIEGGSGNFKIENYLKLNEVYNVSLDWLILGIGSMFIDTRTDEELTAEFNQITTLGGAPATVDDLNGLRAELRAEIEKLKNHPETKTTK